VGVRLVTAHPLREGEQKAGDHKHEVETDHPGQVLLVGVLDLEEGPQEIDAGEGHQRADQLQLEAGKINPAHPLGAIGAVMRHADDRHEIFVAGEDDHEQQIAQEGHVNQLQDLEEETRFVGVEGGQGKYPEMLRKANRQDHKTAHKSQVEDRQHPAAGENDPLDEIFNFHVFGRFFWGGGPWILIGLHGAMDRWETQEYPMTCRPKVKV